jgi:hypothetical protein
MEPESDLEALADILARRYVDAGWLRAVSAEAETRNRPILEREAIEEEKQRQRPKGKTQSQPTPGGLFAAANEGG